MLKYGKNYIILLRLKKICQYFGYQYGYTKPGDVKLMPYSYSHFLKCMRLDSLENCKTYKFARGKIAPESYILCKNEKLKSKTERLLSVK